jgi:hypothetical protein
LQCEVLENVFLLLNFETWKKYSILLLYSTNDGSTVKAGNFVIDV